MDPITLTPIGTLHCNLHSLAATPKSYKESSETGTIEILPAYRAGLDGLKSGDTIIVLLWFQQAQRTILRVHPRGDTASPKRGVFATRSPMRPNPIALSEWTVLAVDDNRITVSGVDALDQTPVLDIKMTLCLPALKQISRLHCLQHVPFEGLANIETWAAGKGMAITKTRFFEDEALPELSDLDWLVVMGGPMNIYQEDSYPWLSKEKDYIRAAIAAGKIVLGICLGAQLIADALGARVYANEAKEIGWFPIRISTAADPKFQALFPPELTVLHWHGDTFELPAGASRLASSAICQNQAFVYQDRVVGLQFHLESTPQSLQTLLDNCSDELTAGGPFIQDRELLLDAKHHFGEIKPVLEKLLDYLYEQAL